MDPTPGKQTPKATAVPARNAQDLSNTLPDEQAPTQVFGGSPPAGKGAQKATAVGAKPVTKPSPSALEATKAFSASPDTARIVPNAGSSSQSQSAKPLEPTEPLAVDTGGAGKRPAAPAPSRTPLAGTGEFVDSADPDGTKVYRETAAAAAKAQDLAAAQSTPKSPDFEPGEVFGDYRLDKKLGEGGMGAVYKAHQISMDRTVALKMLSKKLATNEGFVARFYREAQTMGKLDHPNVVRGYNVGEVNGQHYVAMEFIDGASMQKWMNKLAKLSIADAVHVVLCSAHALQHAHERKLVHRDIKPDNILITNKGVVKVADLGLAKNTDDDMSLTQSGTGFGTPFYMPLEQYRDAKRVDARADVYALGVTLYYFLTGKLPFYGETHFDVIKAKEAAKFIAARRHNPEIPERLDLMIDKMIQKERAHRYQSCADVIEAMESLDLASAFPSFIAITPPTSTKGSNAPTVRASTLPPRSKAAAAAPTVQETPDMWLLRYKDEQGQKVKKHVSSGRLKQLIERDEIDLASATIARPGDEKQRPLASLPEFSALVQSKLVKAKADRRSQKLDTAYAKIERDARRHRIFKAIDNFFRNATSLIILVAVIVALAVGGWWLFRNKDTVIQKMQDAAKSVQESTGSPAPSGTPAPSPPTPPEP